MFTFLQFIADHNGFNSLGRVFEVISIFQYQVTIFMVQYFQMKSSVVVLKGYNLWFTIEIISFYGYILSAILYIIENQIKSSLGMLNKVFIRDEY